MPIVITTTGRDLCRLMDGDSIPGSYVAPRASRALHHWIATHAFKACTALSPTERAVAHAILVAQLTMGCYFALQITAAGPHSAMLRLQVGQPSTVATSSVTFWSMVNGAILFVQPAPRTVFISCSRTFPMKISANRCSLYFLTASSQ